MDSPTIITKRFLIWIQRKHTISYDQNARQFTPADNILDDDQQNLNKRKQEEVGR